MFAGVTDNDFNIGVNHSMNVEHTIGRAVGPKCFYCGVSQACCLG